tara:strand:- start:562 stop:726 length:165 start_codon:yes stop_codon:yes gene_type:complete
MNLKERGVTVGDLLVILILVITTFFIINKIKDGNKQAYFHIDHNDILNVKSHNF